MNDEARAPSEGERPANAAARTRRSFWRRRRDVILTIALVLYTLVLCVAIGDDVLHLGLFPTELERQARGLIARFDDPDEASRRSAADRLVRDVDSFVAVPELIRALDSRSPRIREAAADCLRRLTKTSQQYDPAAPRETRRAAVRRWRQWWAQNRERY